MRPNRRDSLDRVRSRAAVAVLLACAHLGAARAGSVQVSFLEPSGTPVEGAVVTIRELGNPTAQARPVDAVMDQINLVFEPRLLVVPVGSRVSFPNSDVVSHQVYSFSTTKRFQLPLYRGKPYAPVVFDSPGVVTLGCNIHDSMLGYIFVTDAPHYGMTATTGTWQLAQLAPGEYEVAVWHPRMRDAVKPLTQRFTVARGEERIELVVRSDSRLRPDKTIAKRSDWDNY